MEGERPTCVIVSLQTRETYNVYQNRDGRAKCKHSVNPCRELRWADPVVNPPSETPIVIVVNCFRRQSSGREHLQQAKKRKKGKRTSALECRIRRAGGGRKRLTEHDRKLKEALDALVEPTARGDPMCPLRWTCKNTRRLALELTRQGHKISHMTVAQPLDESGYSLQGQRKTRQGSDEPDRDAQFRYICKQVKAFQKRGRAVISVDTKKKDFVTSQEIGVDGRCWATV